MVPRIRVGIPTLGGMMDYVAAMLACLVVVSAFSAGIRAGRG